MMLNARIKNALAICCFIEGFCKTLAEHDDVSKTVAKKVSDLRVANNAAMCALPSPDNKGVVQTAHRIARLDPYVQATTTPYKVVIPSFLLGLVEDAGLTGKRAQAFEVLHQRLRMLELYYDRTLSHTDAYREASYLIKRWGYC